jgi:hypothetical protein
MEMDEDVVRMECEDRLRLMMNFHRRVDYY